ELLEVGGGPDSVLGARGEWQATAAAIPRPESRLGLGVQALVCETQLIDVAIDNLGDLVFGDGAGDLVGDLAALEDQQRGDSANVVAARGVHVLIDIQLNYLELSSVVLRYRSHRRCKHMARTASICT